MIIDPIRNLGTDAERPLGPAVAASGGGYSTIEEDGVPLTQRTTINFVGASVTAADSGGKTVVTITGGSGDSSILRTFALMGA